jgi:tRNA wybutosine-synthesizing protein 1
VKKLQDIYGSIQNDSNGELISSKKMNKKNLKENNNKVSFNIKFAKPPPPMPSSSISASTTTVTKTASSTSCCSSNSASKIKAIDSGNSSSKADSSSCAKGDACCQAGEKKESTKASSQEEEGEQEEEGCCGPDDEEEDDIELDEEDQINEKFVDEDIADMEEIGTMMHTAQLEQLQLAQDKQPREMVTKLQLKALTKEGYRVIGSHSAVKLCRWTKHQLRGRGGCYKHSFYGITSYQCMEATPSLACANKCVFCWRHHKNPVGTEWRWKEDPPDYIVEEAIRLHVGMINEAKGVPGVKPDRLKEAYQVKHCALSLVGEPIMYPHINEMLGELHKRGISTFLVTNAQFPERIEQLDPITQLYVSVDAATKETLKFIDRPLFKDFWERFLGSLKALKSKQQRTVYRMTLVKSWNMDELEGYVSLIEEGLPDLIEIKGVTYCGKSDASTLTMTQVPWHDEVCSYGEEICRLLNDRNRTNGVRYSLATEHQHSLCILIAREDKFKINGEWYTWIDYDAFNRLIHEYYESNGTKTFRTEDYRAKTPDWAIYHAKERGFDPADIRHRKVKGSTTQSEVSSVVG